jgi:hypothetical protein
MKLTRHAKERMAERKITPEEVNSVLGAKETKYAASNSQKSVIKAVNLKENLTVVFEPFKRVILTAYRTKKTKRSKP